MSTASPVRVGRRVRGGAAMFSDMGTARARSSTSSRRFRPKRPSTSCRAKRPTHSASWWTKVAGSLERPARRVRRRHTTRWTGTARARGLCAEAAAALARARTRWDAHEEAERTLSSRSAPAARRSPGSSIDLPPSGADPSSDGERTSLEGDAADARASAVRRRGRRSTRPPTTCEPAGASGRTCAPTRMS